MHKGLAIENKGFSPRGVIYRETTPRVHKGLAIENKGFSPRGVTYRETTPGCIKD